MDAVPDRDVVSQRQDRLLTALERLLELPATAVNAMLTQATQLVAEALASDKVDIFFHDPANDTLVSLGISDTPMGNRQKAIGIDRLPIANDGRIIEVFLTGTSYLTGHADQDQYELVRNTVGMDTKSEIAAVFRVQGQHRGVLLATSTTPNFFSRQDLYFLEAVARWIGIVIGRAELVERKRYETVEQDHRLAAEELIPIMTHSLRNFLTPMRGRIELLEWRARHQGREQDLHDIAAAHNTLQQLERMINDLLDIARLNQGSFAVSQQPMNLTDLVQEVVLTFEAVEIPIHVHTPSELLLSADRDRLRRVLENLLAIMIKYASSDTPIWVKVHSEQRADGVWVILTISNHGSSISPELVVSPFHLFGMDAPSTGLELGLYLTNRIVEAHAGTLTLKSTADQGKQITLSLPVEEEDLSIHD